MCKCSNCNKEVTLNKLIKQVQEQESTLKQLYEQMEQQQELLNEVLWETRKGRLPSRNSRPSTPSKSPFSILENFELDTDKLGKIAMFIGSLYANSNEAEDQ